MTLIKITKADNRVILTYRDQQGDLFTEELSIAMWSEIYNLNRTYRRMELAVRERNRRHKLSEYIEGAYDLQAPDTAYDPVGDRVVDADNLRIILDAVDALTETQRRRLLAYCVEGLTYQQIADREKAGYSPVYRSIQQAVRIIRKNFGYGA